MPKNNSYKTYIYANKFVHLRCQTIKTFRIMRITDYLESLPIGAVITDKRVLSVLKRAGIIYDYSQFGYLESQNVYYKSNWDGRKTTDHIFSYQGKEIKDGEVGSVLNPFPNSSDMYKAGWNNYIDAEYKGFKLGSKYLDGCFNAYLIKKGGKCKEQNTVERRIFLFGKII